MRTTPPGDNVASSLRVRPDAYPFQRGASNNSDAGVTVLSYGPETRRIWTTFTNWNSSGTQYAGVSLYCSK
ncbi:hypothetical protein GCM10009827_024630 [Dactylosporangium maewongense]|uniref:Uncharacterized protein n=1 Tax=Dactylosporangium maewongense TaxID=634393 RepID=A0ABN2A1S1_9ACTN